jgi:2,5-diketo-D-gluconate reductase B
MLPNMGIGTFRLSDAEAREVVRTALELGYRHVDTAQMYDNEDGVGEGIRASGVGRRNVFLTTKIWHDKLRHDALIESLKDSLHRLQVDEVDLALIHWPSPEDQVPMEEYIGALAEARKMGLTHHIGVSNFTATLLDQALACDGGDQIVNNQIEVHPFLRNQKLVEHCFGSKLDVTAYMPLATGKVIDNDVLQDIAKRHDATSAQVALAWLLARDLVVIPSSTHPQHIKANLAALDLQLSDHEIEQINDLDAQERCADPGFAPDWNS